ncbi:MAG: CpsD/CapB family tyrosine-protein kinase [Coriobacteriales bacterium]|jgi:capsular exopolysaccharide synthesis family protein
MARHVQITADDALLDNAAKTLATNIQFASVDNPIRSVEVTSSVPNEGKSSLAVLLAKAMAQGGQRVVLVECDMRRRSLGGILGVHGRSGVYSVLAGAVKASEAVLTTPISGVYLLDCEPYIPNPVDILSSQRFINLIEGLKKDYGYVVVDTPPLSTFVDAAVVSGAVDGTLLVVRQNFVRRDELKNAHDQLKKANANVIGAVMTFCEADKSEQYYSSYYREDGTKVKSPKSKGKRGGKAEAAPTGAHYSRYDR